MRPSVGFDFVVFPSLFFHVCFCAAAVAHTATQIGVIATGGEEERGVVGS